MFWPLNVRSPVNLYSQHISCILRLKIFFFSKTHKDLALINQVDDNQKLSAFCKLSSNQPTGLYVHISGMIQTCTYQYSNKYSPQWSKRGLNQITFIIGNQFLVTLRIKTCKKCLGVKTWKAQTRTEKVNKLKNKMNESKNRLQQSITGKYVCPKYLISLELKLTDTKSQATQQSYCINAWNSTPPWLGTCVERLSEFSFVTMETNL